MTSLASRTAVRVRLPRELHFIDSRHASDWLSTAISEHIARCEEEDAELEHRAEHEEALKMDAAMDAEHTEHTERLVRS